MAYLAPNESQGRAFPSHADPARYFPAEAAESARRRLVMNLARGEGIALLIGSPGYGKSMMLEVLAKELEESLRVVRLASTHICTRRALLQAILFGLGVSYSNRDEGELRLSLIQNIEGPDHSAPPIALFVDEAQSLPIRLLEELRMLSNIATSGGPRLRLLLSGSPALEEILTSPELGAFNQRIAARCYLAPMSRSETIEYVRSHIAASGVDPDDLLSDDVYSTIYQASDGLPRLVNQVCDRALVMAVESESESITAEAIQAAWSDLHQLPAPWHASERAPLASRSAGPETRDASQDDVVEFGLLEDEPAPTDTPQTEEKSPAPISFSTPPSTGEWNADAALETLGSLTTEELELADEVDQDDAIEPDPNPWTAFTEETTKVLIERVTEETEELVSLAFPAPDEDAQRTDDPLPEDEERTELDDTEEYEFAEDGWVYEGDPKETAAEETKTATKITALDVEDVTPSGDPFPRAREYAHDPFEEHFEEEEEILLDRCRGLEAVLRHDAQTVTNLQDISFGLMFQALTPAVECLLEDVRSRIDGPVIGGGLSLVAQPSQLVDEDPFEDLELISVTKSTPLPRSMERPEVIDHIEDAYRLPTFDEEDDLLIIEEEVPAGRQEVARKDYSTLFAGLRRS